MKTLLFFISLLCLQAAYAKGVYQTPESFIDESFNGQTAQRETVWLNKEYKQVIGNILQHSPRFLRVKYWRLGTKTVWVLNEVGKEKLITVGILIDHDKIERLKVLTFRESRGWEVKHDFFTRQFSGLALNEQHQLSQTVDGISGATLSVRALKKMARIALYLNQQRSQ